MKNILFIDLGSRYTKYSLFRFNESFLKEDNLKNSKTAEENDKFLEPLLVGISDSQGITLGRVTDYYDYETFINDLFESIKKEANIQNIDNIFISVGGYNLYTTVSSIKEEVNNQEITSDFIYKWINGELKVGKIESQKFVVLPEDYQNIISILPRMYIVDSVDKSYNPFGLIAKNSIEVEILICSIGTEYKKVILKPFEKLGYEFFDNITLNQKNSVVFLPNIINYSKALGSYKDLKDYPPFVVMDFGYSTIEMILILEGTPYTRIFVKRGVKNILKDISFALGTDIYESERVLNEIKDISKKNGDEIISFNTIFSKHSKEKVLEKVSKSVVVDTVIIPRLEEISKIIKSAISNFFNVSIISNVVMVGGGAKIKGIDNIFSNLFEIKFSLFDCKDEKFNDLQLINLYGMKQYFSSKIKEEFKKNKYPLLKAVNKVSSKNFFERVWLFFKNYFFGE